MCHPFTITRSKVIIDRYDMHSLPSKRIQIHRSNRNERFSFSSLHFSNFPLMENNSSEKLNIIRNHIPGKFMSFDFCSRPNKSFTSLFCHSKSLWKQIIQTASVFNSLFKFIGFCLDFSIRKCIKFSIPMIDISHKWHQSINLLLIIITTNHIHNPV